MKHAMLLGVLLVVSVTEAQATEIPLLRVVDLNVGQSQQVRLHDGQFAKLTLLKVRPQRDHVMNALRQVEVDIRLLFDYGTVAQRQRRLA